MVRFQKNIQEVECPEPVEGAFFVYMLLCKDDSFYCGSTVNVKKSLKEHYSGEASLWTRMRRPVYLIYYESYPSLILARRREEQIKGWTRKKKMNLINGLWTNSKSL